MSLRSNWLVAAGVLAISVLGAVSPAWAQVSYQIQSQNASTPLAITGTNITRPDNALILYTPDYTETTRTNPYGVEVIAEKVNTATNTYKVVKVTETGQCQASNKLSDCGNAHIPENGIVLSASGNQRQTLQQAMQVGSTFELRPQWFQTRSWWINTINPNASTNPGGRSYPGFRASQQLLIYDKAYGKPTTGTNEFGFEVTVVDGVVVAQEGADSHIPDNGYVLSGHGKSRDWLIANAPIGARITLNITEDKKTLTSTVDLDTYRYQLKRRMESAGCMAQIVDCPLLDQANARIDQLALAGRKEEAAQMTVNTLEELNREMWRMVDSFPANAIRGAWHRPVEKSRAQVGHTLDWLKSAGINSVFLETFYHGYTIFPSQTMARYGLPTQRPEFARLQGDNDVLKWWLDEAHKRDMKVHTWFQTFYVGSKILEGPGPILSKYPQWANIQFSALDDKLKPKGLIPSTLENSGFFMDPANPEVRKFDLALVEELITRYPIDGFQLDYIRYPASFPPDRFSFQKTTWGYTDLARSDFMTKYGVDPATLTPDQQLWEVWNNYKTTQVSTFVQQVSELIRNKNPKVQLSAAVFPSTSSKVTKHQDWPVWGSRKWVDFLAPMTLTSAEKVVYDDTARMISLTNGQVPIVAGIFSPFNNNTAEQMLQQIQAAKQNGGSGFAIFDTAHLTGRMARALNASSRPQPRTRMVMDTSNHGPIPNN